MRFFSVLRMGEAYARFALLVLIAAFIVFCLAYFVIYKKCMHGTRTLKVKQVLLWGLLLGYLLVVLCATMLDRSGITMRQVNLKLFDSYIQAWQQMDNTDWRNLILNILMFVPVGFLLPLAVRKCRVFWKTALCGLAFSALIEFLQFLTGRGITEADDLLNNTVGALIGYGFAYLVLRLFHRKEGKRLWLFTAQLPLLAVVLVFAGIYGIYEHQEYGNLALAGEKNLTVTCEKTLDSSERTVPIYQIKRYSQSEVVAFANQILAHKDTSVDESSLDAYDNTLVCRAEDGSCHIWVDYAGLGFDYNDFDQMESETEPQAKSGCGREEIEQALGKLGFTVPAQAEFAELTGEQQGTYQFQISNYETSDGKLLDGTLSCEYMADKSLQSVQQHILTYEKYKDCEIFSQQEALEQLKAGKYLENNFGSNSGKEKLSVAVKKVRFSYVTDSKGFYQPAWVFQAAVNGESRELVVPARKK